MIPFQTLWRAFWNQLHHRLRYVFREALAQSLGVQLIALGALTVSALCARIVITSYLAYYSAVTEQLQTSTREGEPRSDLEFPAIFGAILAPINGELTKWEPAALSPGDDVKIKRLVRTFVSLSEYALACRTLPPNGQRAALAGFDSTLVRLVPESKEFPDAGDWRRRVRSHFAQVLNPPDSLLVVKPVPINENHTARMALQGPVGTLREDRAQSLLVQTTLQIPSTFTPTVAETTTLRGLMTRPMKLLPPYLDPEVMVSATTSAFLEDALDLVRMKDGAIAPNNSQTPIVQAYFISEKGALRIWEPRDPWNELPTNRGWASAHYVQRFYSQGHGRDDHYMTPPYIDVGQNGIVRTYTHVVRAMNRPDSSAIFGVIAVDYRLPLDDYLESLARQNVLFELHQLVVPMASDLRSVGAGNSSTLLMASPVNGRRIGKKKLWQPEKDAGLLARVRQYGLEHGKNDQMNSLGMLSGFPEPEWILPLQSNTGGAKTFLIIKPRTPHVPVDLYGFAMVSFACFILSLYLIFRWRGRVAEQERLLGDTTLMRNLAVGLFTVDSGGIISDANQVACWLLATTLPQFGEHRGENFESRRFSQIVLPTVVPAQGIQPGQTVVPTKRLDEEIEEARTQLRSSTYYAKVRETGTIVRVSGGPVIHKRQSRDRALPERSAMIVPADPATAQFLRDNVEAWRDNENPR